MLPKTWNKIKLITKLINLTWVNFSMFWKVAHSIFEFIFWKAFAIFGSDIVNWEIELTHVLVGFCMLRRPLIKIYFHLQNLRLQQRRNLNTLFQYLRKVLQEQVMRIEAILVLYQITNDLLDWSRLIVSDSCVYRILIIKFDVVGFSFFKLVLIEDWVFFTEEVGMLFVEEWLHRAGIEAHDGG